ncbi:transposase [Pontibacter sp. G13]|uniref:transposase n=1 Tax=Pontibacter sp. G13 TaxID=3074898 RepID=UPI00288BED9B|nr:transposase [Pontibacter sp. G13]WNJ17576.1 transposase [Pontibacter sp. G13]
MKKRKRYSAEFKFKVAVAALREQETMAQLASHFGISSTQISTWKKQLKEMGPSVFLKSGTGRSADDQELIDGLYRKVGEMEMRLEWLKKKGLIE